LVGDCREKVRDENHVDRKDAVDGDYVSGKMFDVMRRLYFLIFEILLNRASTPLPAKKCTAWRGASPSTRDASIAVGRQGFNVLMSNSTAL